MSDAVATGPHGDRCPLRCRRGDNRSTNEVEATSHTTSTNNRHRPRGDGTPRPACVVDRRWSDSGHDHRPCNLHAESRSHHDGRRRRCREPTSIARAECARQSGRTGHGTSDRTGRADSIRNENRRAFSTRCRCHRSVTTRTAIELARPAGSAKCDIATGTPSDNGTPVE